MTMMAQGAGNDGIVEGATRRGIVQRGKPLSVRMEAGLEHGQVERAGRPFKTCSSCGRLWQQRSPFLADPAVELVGYQSFLEELELGLVLFNHSDCGTTLAIPAGEFVDLHDGPVFTQRLTGSDACRGLCEQRRALEACPNECECAWVRDVLQVIRVWPKHRVPR